MERSAGSNKEVPGKDDNLNLRSEEVEEIMGKPPAWLVRRGTGVLGLVVVILIAGSGFFRYPDLVRAPVIITRENPASVLAARVSGRPEVIFFPDGAFVNKGDTLAVLENSARHHDIFRLVTYIGLFNRLLYSEPETVQIEFPGDMVLGEVQPAYNDFATSWNDYRIFRSQDFFEMKIAALTAELHEYMNYRRNLERQRELALKEIKLFRIQYDRDSALFYRGVISSSDFEKTQALLLNKQKALESAALNLSDAGIATARLERSIADARLEREEKQQKLTTSLVNSFRQLESSLGSWENSYLLTATTSGTLNYLSIWSSLQELAAGDALFSIIPDNMGKLYARIILPFRGAGKVKEGQRVNIKLDGYPYMEFGMLEGMVYSVSGGPVEDGFPAVVTLTKGAVTSFDYELDVVRELPGMAEISTDELSLLERLLHPLRHLIKNRTFNDLG